MDKTSKIVVVGCSCSSWLKFKDIVDENGNMILETPETDYHISENLLNKVLTDSSFRTEYGLNAVRIPEEATDFRFVHDEWDESYGGGDYYFNEYVIAVIDGKMVDVDPLYIWDEGELVEKENNND